MAKVAVSSKREAVLRQAARFQPREERREIEQLAYRFFVERGYAHGHDVEDWLRAEAVIRSRRS